MLKTIEQKQVSAKLTKGLLDIIILQLLTTEPMHGYQIIVKIRKNYGISFGPSTVYPLLNSLQHKGYIESKWEMDSRPRKIFCLTADGQTMLSFTEESLNFLCRKIAIINPEPDHQTTGINFAIRRR